MCIPLLNSNTWSCIQLSTWHLDHVAYFHYFSLFPLELFILLTADLLQFILPTLPAACFWITHLYIAELLQFLWGSQYPMMWANDIACFLFFFFISAFRGVKCEVWQSCPVILLLPCPPAAGCLVYPCLNDAAVNCWDTLESCREVNCPFQTNKCSMIHTVWSEFPTDLLTFNEHHIQNGLFCMIELSVDVWIIIHQLANSKLNLYGD